MICKLLQGGAGGEAIAMVFGCLLEDAPAVPGMFAGLEGVSLTRHRLLLQGGAGGEAISMGFGCLPEDAPAVLGMFADLVQSPALPQQRIDLYKAQVRGRTSRRKHGWNTDKRTACRFVTDSTFHRQVLMMPAGAGRLSHMFDNAAAKDQSSTSLS